MFEHVTRRSRLRATCRQRRTSETFTEIHETVHAEARDRFSCASVKLLQITARGEDDPPVRPVFALPVVETAIRRGAFGLVGPVLLAGRGVERKYRTVFPNHIHDVVYDKRAERKPSRGTGCGVEPLKLELMHVAL